MVLTKVGLIKLGCYKEYVMPNLSFKRDWESRVIFALGFLSDIFACPYVFNRRFPAT